MTIFTRDFNRNSSYWTAILFYLICGLLLLLMPNLALSIANVALAILLCAVGVRSIVSYLRGSILDGVMGLQLAAGLVALCFALLLLFNPLFLAELLPFVWGVALLVGGFGKVQMAADLKRIGDRFWWYALIAALLSSGRAGHYPARIHRRCPYPVRGRFPAGGRRAGSGFLPDAEQTHQKVSQGNGKPFPPVTPAPSATPSRACLARDFSFLS